MHSAKRETPDRRELRFMTEGELRVDGVEESGQLVRSRTELF